MSIIQESIRHLEIIEQECDKIKCSCPNSFILQIEAKAEVTRAIKKFKKLGVAEGELNPEVLK